MPHRTDNAALFERLGIEELNPATALGDGSWRSGIGGFASIDPAIGEPLAMVQRAMPDDLEMAVASAACRSAAATSSADAFPAAWARRRASIFAVASCAAMRSSSRRSPLSL